MRVDSHIFAGYRIPTFYDNLLAKICVHSDTRANALAQMQVALHELDIAGAHTNKALHQTLLADSDFVAGGVSIHYLETKLADDAVFIDALQKTLASHKEG